jgi:hypothetical protein
MPGADINRSVGLADRNEPRQRSPAFSACETQDPVPLRWTSDALDVRTA